MAKTKKLSVDDDSFFEDLASDTGGVVLAGSGESKYFLDTGNLALNWCNSGRFGKGGVPTGITEIFGPSASAKSYIAMTIAAACQRMKGVSILLDFERAAGEDFAKNAAHVNTKQLIVIKPRYIEECAQKIIDTINFIRAKKGPDVPIFFIWDSIGVAMCYREFKEQSLPSNYTQADYKRIVGGKEQPGERAKAAGAFLRKINPFLDENNASLFIINQVRYKIGVMYGNPETTAGGGNGLPYYANTRIRSSAQKSIIDTKKSTATSKVACGVNLKFANKKARACAPFKQVEGIQLYFDRGINPLGGLLAALINDGRVEGKGTYKINEPWAGGQDIKFKASVTDNTVPLEILYKCPKLVDFDTEEELKEYLLIFSDAINIAPDSIKEIAVEGEEGDSEEDDGEESEVLNSLLEVEDELVSENDE